MATMRAAGVQNPPGDVLGEHREHLGLQRDHVRHADPHRREDQQPADDEEQVVRREDAEPEHELDDVRVLQPRAGLRPDVAHRPGERAEERRDARELEDR
jgi:hypothetical protein